MRKLAETRMPTSSGEFRMMVYESEFPDFPHTVLMKPSDNQEVFNVRIHSECMTGDVFGSSRCDCGQQLQYAMRHFGENGGILIYLRQEGRGIGLVNKVKAYNLQDKGMDTIAANLALGFHADDRDYAPAIQILNDLGVKKINLFTNNPEKVSSFKDTEIEVISRQPVEIDPGEENASYLKTKQDNMGHIFSRIKL
ncbi:MAG: GTP cyclohydrolase II [Flavobacteriales bacterium]|nr:GTP cyclohydrolase II [Flavobacteriales bacterium]